MENKKTMVSYLFKGGIPWLNRTHHFNDFLYFQSSKNKSTTLN